MKKYLLGLLAVPIMSPLLSIASANTVDGYTSDSEICVYNVDYETSSLSPSPYGDCGREDYNEECVYSYVDLPSGDLPVYVENGFYCNESDAYYTPQLVSSMPISLRVKFWDSGIYLYESYTSREENTPKQISSGKMYISKSPITYNPNSGGSSSDSVLPELSVPSSFTSGITQLVNNFGSTISEWIPIVILVTLGITAIFALFRVVRNYARRSFKG